MSEEIKTELRNILDYIDTIESQQSVEIDKLNMKLALEHDQAINIIYSKIELLIDKIEQGQNNDTTTTN